MRFKHTGNKLVIALVAAALLGGCASYTPKPLLPLEEYETIRLRSVSQHDGTQATDAEVFGFPLISEIDPRDGISIAEANTLALFYSPKILEKRRELQIADAILLEAGLPENPAFFFGPRWSTEGTGLISPASLTFEVPILDEHGPRRESAEHQVRKNRWLLLERELEVLAEVQKQALRLAALEAREDISKLQVQRSEELVAWVESLYGSGEINSFSRQVARRAFEHAQTKLMDTTLETKRQRRDLLVSFGFFPNADVSLELNDFFLLELQMSKESKEEIVRHPTLKALEEEYRAAEKNLKAEVRSQYPHLAVGPQYEGDRGEPTIGFGVGFEIPIFARNDTAIALAESKRASVRGRYQATLLELLKNSANLRDELEALEKRLHELEANAVREAKELDRVFSSSLASADRAVLEALSAGDSLAETLSEEITLRERRNLTYIELLLVSGSLLPKELNIEDQVSGEENE